MSRTREEQKAYYAANRERIRKQQRDRLARERAEGTFRPATCHPHKPDVRRGLCQACSSREWRKLNPERYREVQRRAELKGKGRKSARTKAVKPWKNEALRYKKHAWYEANRSRCCNQSRDWRRKNRDRVYAAQCRRRARLQDGVSPGVTPAQWADILARYQGLCAYCGAEATERDHITPIRKGGLDEPRNVVPACKRCNASKGAFWVFG